VFQDPDDQLFMPSVQDDVAFGPLNLGLPEEEVRARVARALDQVGMRGVEDRSPHHLSFGERKRVALATVLAMQPEVLVLDEPTANLDPRARRQLLSLLPTLPQTQLIATHDLEAVAELCPRVLLLDRGQIFADGPAEEILRDTVLLEAHGLEVPVSWRN
jgi:cobalt/nickel transport system ATP-binding protein